MRCPSCQTEVADSQKFCPSCGTALAPAGGSEAGPDVMIGQTLGGKYTVVRLLGEGGMGAVYEGEQQLGTTKRKVAVKTLHPHLSRDPKIKARFEREVGTIAELEHPNTIQVFDFGSTGDGILYIVMEFLHGKSLADTLEKEGAMQPQRVGHIMEQVCGSLAEAHGRGIVHRDLKPDNVVLVERAGKKDFVKVLDFGIAKRSREEDKNEQKLTQQGMVLGTPPYMSPEQFTGKPIDARSDIYSLGVMAYEMLTGKLPFKADTAWEWASQHMTANPIPIESLAEGMRAPEPMRAAIRRALAKAPEDRFQDVKDFSDAFTGAAGAAAGMRPGPAPVAVPADPTASSGGRQRTEIGTPLDVGAAFGAGPGGPVSPPVAATPAAGNMAFPAPGGIPQPPPRDTGGGRNKGLILGAAAAIGLLSIGAIVFALKGSGGTPAAPLPTASFNSDPVTVLSGSSQPIDTSVPSVDTSGIPSLNGGSGGPPSSSGGHSSSGGGPSSSGGKSSSGSGGGSGGGGGGSCAGKPVYDGPECQNARKLKALGRTKEAQPWVLACIAKCGNPN
jgi:tRNA A-37 threonylcarbamoyl transferase component Bud32